MTATLRGAPRRVRTLLALVGFTLAVVVPVSAQRATWVDDTLPLRLLSQGSATVFRVDVVADAGGAPAYRRGETLRGDAVAAAALFARFADERPWRALVPAPGSPPGGLLAFGHEHPRVDDAIVSGRVVLRWAASSALPRLAAAEARLAGEELDLPAAVLDLTLDPATLRDGLLDADLAFGHRRDRRVPDAERLDAEALRAAVVARAPALRAVLRATAKGVAEGRRIGRWNSALEESRGIDFDIGLVFALLRTTEAVAGTPEGEAVARSVRAWLGPGGSRAGRPGPGWPSVAAALARAAAAMGEQGAAAAPALERLHGEAGRQAQLALATFGHGVELATHAQACEAAARDVLDALLGPADDEG